MWYGLSDDLVLYILCFVTKAALPIVARLDTLCHGFAGERLSSLKRLTEKPFYVQTSDIFHGYVFNLINKKLKNDGVLVLAGALSSGSLPALKKLFLNSNQIGDAGMSAFASACASGALDKIQSIELFGNLGDSAPVDNAIKVRKK
jgi:hypothetical protein